MDDQRRRSYATPSMRYATPGFVVPELASRTDRRIAQILDTLVAYSGPVVVLLGIGTGSTGRDLGLLHVLVFVAAFGYILFADGLQNGQSLGKRVLGLAVIDEQTGADCTFLKSFVRNFLMCLGFWDWIFIFGVKHQRLGDKAAGTIVVYRRR